jgi:hypothetical protein
MEENKEKSDTVKNFNYDMFKKVVESCHINLLIGSGASKPFLNTLGNVESLLEELSKIEIDDNIKIILDASIKKYYYDKVIKENLKIPNIKNTDKTFETYNNLIQSLGTILANRKSNLISKQVNIFTTNMDLFLDKVIDDSKFEFNDGFKGRFNPIFGTENFNNSIVKTSMHYEYKSEVPLFNLFKLHGSLDWKLTDEDKIVFDKDLTILTDIEQILSNATDLFLDIQLEEKIDNKDYIKKLTKLQQKEKLIQKSKDCDEFLSKYNELVMINPTKDKFEKTTKKLTFYELLRMYSNYLEKTNSVLFVIGFSFNDEHIREITTRVTASNPTLLIIIFAYDIETAKKAKNYFYNLNNVIIINDEQDEIKYSLERINNEYFSKLAVSFERKE